MVGKMKEGLKRVLNVVSMAWLIGIFVVGIFNLGHFKYFELEGWMTAITVGLSFLIPMSISYILGFGFKLFHKSLH